MNNLQNVINRLSLRAPQAESLNILGKVASQLKQKNDEWSEVSLEDVSNEFPTCTDFERDFPSITFSLATGVGKTRLMGAFISYLYLENGIKHFFVIAPGSTIYNKLVDDLSNSSSPKYVFRGIAEFTVTPPRIITSDNFEEARMTSLFGESVVINIFNIQKIASEMRGGKEPKIKRLSEYLGESYFTYLSELKDLVILMDESHHYRAAAGMQAINELKAILGLELTATPIDSKGNKFRNVVYEYSLAHALRDGFLKEPVIATRKNFNPEQYKNNQDELDVLKLEDGIRIHEDTKVALDIYSRDTGVPLVKPFMLVVAKDTEHASVLKKMIESDNFFEGNYRGKVIEIHSNQRGTEKEENIQQLLQLEDPDNKIEVVIHVNMLKEGWDVTNLYTIVPLRTANSQILTEQTIGRGLRLPYEKRTGDKKVDRLTIIAHDKFQAIIEEANKPDSIIKKENIIELDQEDLETPKEILVSEGNVIADIQQQISEIPQDIEPLQKQQLENRLSAVRMLAESVSYLGEKVSSITDLSADEVKEEALKHIKEQLDQTPQKQLFENEILQAAKEQYDAFVSDVIENIIPIPRILIHRSDDITAGFHDFDLETSNINYQPVSEEILIRSLEDNSQSSIASGETGYIRDTPQNIILNELINFPEVDYERDMALLNKLTSQLLLHLSGYMEEKDIKNVTLYFRKEIAASIHSQMSEHFFIEEGNFEEPTIYPFSKIEEHNLAKYKKDDILDLNVTVEPTSSIPMKIFTGFKKACHRFYKFDNKTEKDFAIILENDDEVQKWLRPASKQFVIYWDHNSKRYEPDFVVETENTIYMVEPKAEKDLETDEVKSKAESAKEYCRIASEYNSKHGGKQWEYRIIPHTIVQQNMSFSQLMSQGHE